MNMLSGLTARALTALVLAASAAATPASYCLTLTDALEGGSASCTVPKGQEWRINLGFSTSQSQMFDAADKAKETVLGPLRLQLADTLRQLQRQIAAQASDEDIQVALDLIGKIRAAIREENDKYESELAAFLTPVQRAKILVGLPSAASASAAAPAPDPRVRAVQRPQTPAVREDEEE